MPFMQPQKHFISYPPLSRLAITVKIQIQDIETLGAEPKNRVCMLLTLNAWRKGFRSFISFANDTLPSPFPSEAGSTSKTTISKGCVSKGSASKAKNPGFNTAQT